MSDIERSESGNPIYRHEPRERGWEPPAEECRHLEEIEAHLAQYIGEVDNVFHELVSDLVHLDVLVVPASEDRPFHMLVTSGASDRPMTVPEGAEDFRFAELLVLLPPDWPIEHESFDDENNYWPVRWLKTIARLPHEYETWIAWGHTIPNGDPPEKIANTRFTGFILLPPFWFDPEFFRLETKSGETICFYVLTPLYQEEMDLKLKKGADALEELFEKHQIGPVVDPLRKNVAKRRGFFG